MNTTEIAARLYELCSQNLFETAQDELFHPDAESFEPEGSFMQYAKGLAAIKAKGDAFQASVVEMHGGHLSEPIVAGNYIAMTMGMDVTLKEIGRTQMDEIAMYKVADGKISEERFFY